MVISVYHKIAKGNIQHDQSIDSIHADNESRIIKALIMTDYLNDYAGGTGIERKHHIAALSVAVIFIKGSLSFVCELIGLMLVADQYKPHHTKNNIVKCNGSMPGGGEQQTHKHLEYRIAPVKPATDIQSRCSAE